MFLETSTAWHMGSVRSTRFLKTDCKSDRDAYGIGQEKTFGKRYIRQGDSHLAILGIGMTKAKIQLQFSCNLERV